MDGDVTNLSRLTLNQAGLDSSETSAILIGLDHRVISANQAAIKVFGPHEMQFCYEYLASSPVPCNQCASISGECDRVTHSSFTNVVSGNRYNNIQVPLTLQDGSKAILLLVYDITGQRFIAEQAARLNSDYHRLFTRTQEGIFRVDLEGAFLAANPAFAEILGFGSVQEMMSSGLTAFDFYESPEVRRQFLERLMAGGTLRDFETGIRTAKGLSKWVSISAMPVEDEEGIVIEMEGLLMDIDRRKSAEDLLRRRTADAERSSREAQAYLDLITHDIANLLTPVVTHAELISAAGMSQDQMAEHSEFIKEQLLRSSRFISRVRMLSDARSVSDEDQPPTDIWDALTTAVMLTNHRSDGRSVRIYGSRPTSSLLTSGRIHLSQVFEEILDNAVAHSDLGEVRVEVSFRHGAAVDGQPIHIVELTDEGDGIGPKAMEQLTMQIRSCALGARRGVISGLLFCASILSIVDGRIEVGHRADSDPSKGTRVAIHLPVEGVPQ